MSNLLEFIDAKFVDDRLLAISRVNANVLMYSRSIHGHVQVVLGLHFYVAKRKCFIVFHESMFKEKTFKS